MNELLSVANGVQDAAPAIQTLLDKGGYVYIPDGEYCIAHPLILHSNTHLHLSQNAHLRVADHAHCSLLDNDGLYTHETTRNITIEGGIWDGNHDHQERRVIPNENLPCDEQVYIKNDLLVLVVRLVHVEHLTVRNVTFRDPTTYAIHIADARYFLVENVRLDYNLARPNMDGVHIQGPARFGRIYNVMGNANDDHVALCANGTTRSEITHGDIEDIDICGIYCSNGYTGVRLLSCGDAIRNISISQIHGQFRFFAVSFTHHYPLREDKPVLLENVHISDVFAAKSTAHFPEHHILNENRDALIWFESGTNCRHIRIENVYRNECNPATHAPTVRISHGANVQDLQISDILQQFAGEPIEAVEDLR